jgi:phosphate transport system protein
MQHQEKESAALRKNIGDMWSLVQSQLVLAGEALFSVNKDQATEVITREKRVNAFELLVESDCENYIALFNPVAIDLRLMLSLLKINTNLERIADFAEGIARYVMAFEKPAIDPELLLKLRLHSMYDEMLEMFNLTRLSLDREDSRLAGSIFAKDDVLDEINKAATPILADHIRNHPDQVMECLYLLSIIRKIERVGDHCNNIAEEIVFYLDAKILKHAGTAAREAFWRGEDAGVTNCRILREDSDTPVPPES